jgi:hypothetical protein
MSICNGHDLWVSETYMHKPLAMHMSTKSLLPGENTAWKWKVTEQDRFRFRQHLLKIHLFWPNIRPIILGRKRFRSITSPHIGVHHIQSRLWYLKPVKRKVRCKSSPNIWYTLYDGDQDILRKVMWLEYNYFRKISSFKAITDKCLITLCSLSSTLHIIYQVKVHLIVLHVPACYPSEQSALCTIQNSLSLIFSQIEATHQTEPQWWTAAATNGTSF